MGVMETVRAMFATKRAQAATTYQSLVEAAAAGAEPPEGADVIVFAANKTLADFEADVSELVARNEAEAQLRAADNMQRDVDAAAAAHRDAVAEVARLDDEYREARYKAMRVSDEASLKRHALELRQRTLRNQAREVLRSVPE